MVPGMVIFNAIRDTLAGNYQAGLNRTAEACLIAAAIATGTGLALERLYYDHDVVESSRGWHRLRDVFDSI